MIDGITFRSAILASASATCGRIAVRRDHARFLRANQLYLVAVPAGRWHGERIRLDGIYGKRLRRQRYQQRSGRGRGGQMLIAGLPGPGTGGDSFCLALMCCA